MPTDHDRDAARARARRLFHARVRAALKRADEAFRGEYADAIDQLSGLSRDDLDTITADVTDQRVYQELMEVVKEAPRVNLIQAELKDRIEDLGEVAVAIARKAPRLAAIL